MKTRIFTVLFLSLCCIFGAINIDAQLRSPKVYYKTIQTPPPPPVKPMKKVPHPKILNPVGHIYGFSIWGHKIMFNFNPIKEKAPHDSPFSIAAAVPVIM